QFASPPDLAVGADVAYGGFGGIIGCGLAGGPRLRFAPGPHGDAWMAFWPLPPSCRAANLVNEMSPEKAGFPQRTGTKCEERNIIMAAINSIQPETGSAGSAELVARPAKPAS